jgi:hypothetical protein
MLAVFAPQPRRTVGYHALLIRVDERRNAIPNPRPPDQSTLPRRLYGFRIISNRCCAVCGRAGRNVFQFPVLAKRQAFHVKLNCRQPVS